MWTAFQGAVPCLVLEHVGRDGLDNWNVLIGEKTSIISSAYLYKNRQDCKSPFDADYVYRTKYMLQVQQMPLPTNLVFLDPTTGKKE